MGYLMLPMLLIALVPEPSARGHRLEDFSRFSQAIGKEVSVIDQSGLVREGTVESATGDGVALRIGSARRWFPRAEVVSAQRLHDGRIDGVIKGALIGTLLAGVASQGCVSHDQCASWRVIGVFAAAGYALDAAQSNRRPLYRAPVAAPTLKVSFRF